MRIARGLPTGSKRKTAVFTLLLMLMARCFDKIEAAVPQLRPVRAVSALPAAAYLAACGQALRGASAPRPVAIPAPSPGNSYWL